MDDCNVNALSMATKLRERYDNRLQAVTTIGQCMTKALFAGNTKAVLYWALVNAHYQAPYGRSGSSIADLSEIKLPDPNGIDL